MAVGSVRAAYPDGFEFTLQVRLRRGHRLLNP
jgi:hypothetical protein